MYKSHPTEKYIEEIDLSRLQLLGQGRTAEVYLYGGDRVVKLFRPAFPKLAIENEYLVCQAIGGSINIPKAYRRLLIDGRDAIIFDFIRGESGFRYLFWHPWRVREFAHEFAAIHSRIHAIALPETVPDLKGILVRNMNLHNLLPEATKKRIAAYLEGLPSGNVLCHGDYHPDNILLQKGTPYVLDWMTGTRGNPMADVARTSLLLRWAQPGPGTPRLIRTMLSSFREKFYTYYIHHYMELTGARAEEIERWELPVLAARLMEWIPPSEKDFLISLINEKLERT